ncbi:MAG: CAAD domain-containing protein [Cyanobacteriota bacterium]
MAETPSSPAPEPSTVGGAAEPDSPAPEPLAEPGVAAPPGGEGPSAEEPSGAPMPSPLASSDTPESPVILEASAPGAPPEAELPPPAPPAVETPSAPLEVSPPPVAAAAESEAWSVAAIEVVVEAEAAGDAGEPRVATTLEVPPLSVGEAGRGAEGGEWELLVGKAQAWLEQADLPGQWDRLSGPLRGLGLLLGVLIVLKLYGAVLDTLDDLPLLPRLLQLVGLLALLRFSLTRLTRSSDRQEILADWKRRWDTFSGS